MKKMVKMILIYVLIIACLITVDQVSKIVAFRVLEKNKSYSVIPHIIRFELAENDGAMFSILSGKRTLFFIMTILGLGIFGYMLKMGDFKNYPYYTIGLCLMISGTIGNFIDRVIAAIPSSTLTGVRDFITFDFFNFAIFNFADMCMCVGVVMLAIDILFSSIGEKWK